MDQQKTIEIIEALAHGVHPITGENIDAKGVFQYVEIKDALNEVISLMKIQKDQLEFSDFYHPPKRLITEAHLKGHSIIEIADRYHTAPRTIIRRLGKCSL